MCVTLGYFICCLFDSAQPALCHLTLFGWSNQVFPEHVGMIQGGNSPLESD